MDSSHATGSIPLTYFNIYQSPADLAELYGPTDYYWYLRSPEYQQHVLLPMARVIDSWGGPCLDAACGEALLADMVAVPYRGFDGSSTSLGRAVQRRKELIDQLRVGRLEDPPTYPDMPAFTTLILSAILEVLVNPVHRRRLVWTYQVRYQPRYLLVSDLKSFDPKTLTGPFGDDPSLAALPPIHLLQECDLVLPPLYHPDGTPLIEVKRYRKMWAFSLSQPA